MVDEDPASVSQPSAHDLQLLDKHFGLKNFKTFQWKIICAVERKQDVLGVIKCGEGKSLCFQYPALSSKGITLVICPLIALMQDQLIRLKNANIKACLLGSAQENPEEANKEILNGDHRIVFLTPEYLDTQSGIFFMKNLSKSNVDVSHIVVDEAHCISILGHDYRETYRKITDLREETFPNASVTALTATATPQVAEDIIKMLKLRKPLAVRTKDFGLSNLQFKVYKNLKQTDILNMMIRIAKSGEPTLIYCYEKKVVNVIAAALTKNEIPCVIYHPDVDDRKKNHESFLNDECMVMVATESYGMGIDKSNIRNVIHYGCPKTIEEYYVKNGRAGRDGLPAQSVLFWSDADLMKIYVSLEDTKNCVNFDLKLTEFKNFLRYEGCHQRFISDYLDGRKCCDNCYDGEKKANKRKLSDTPECSNEKEIKIENEAN